MRKLFLDIETVPSQNAEKIAEIYAKAKADWKLPTGLTKAKMCAELALGEDEAKALSAEQVKALYVDKFGAEEIAKAADEAYHKTSFDGALGELAVIGFAFDDNAPVTICRASNSAEDEKEILSKFFADLTSNLMHEMHNTDMLEDVQIIGHNVEAFDLPFLFKRAVILGIKPPINLQPNRYSDSVYDTMIEWAGFGNRISQDNLCKALGTFNSKDSGMDGSQVWEYVKSGRIAEVAEYCANDVLSVRANYKRMTFSE